MLRYRLLFAIIGLVSCLAMALLGELIIRATHLQTIANSLNEQVLVLPIRENGRVIAAGGHPGEVEITLEWHNKNDLDLSCIDPQGHRIWYGDKRSPTGGHLDVDANASVYTLTSTPVEHIVWPYGSAPHGIYQVFVTYFAQHDQQRSSAFHVTVNNNGHFSQYGGTLSQRGTRVGVDAFTLNTSAGLGASQIAAALATALICAGWTCWVLALLPPALWWFRRRFPISDGEKSALTTTDYLHTCSLFAMAGFIGQLAFLFANWFLMETSSVTHVQLSYHFFDYATHLIGFAVLGAIVGAAIRFKVPGLHSPWIAPVIMLVGAAAGWVFSALLYSPREPGRVLVALLVGAGIGFMIVLVREIEVVSASLTPPPISTSSGLTLNRSSPAGTLPGLRAPRHNSDAG